MLCKFAYTLSGPSSTELVVKKSKFISFSGPVHCNDDVIKFLEEYRHPKATHNCFAYKINDCEKADDDNEVSGTAGLPILHAIKSSGFDHIIVLVVRYVILIFSIKCI